MALIKLLARIENETRIPINRRNNPRILKMKELI